MTESCDVVIVGSRLAGACAASHPAHAGRRVVALDRARFPSEKRSTRVLFPAGVDELRRMGAPAPPRTAAVHDSTLELVA